MTASVVPARRRTELGLVVLAAGVTIGGTTLASLGKVGAPPAGLGAFAAVVAALLVAAHVAVRKLAPAADGVMLPLALVLNGIGYVFIARLSQRQAGLQSMWTAVGVVAFVATLAGVRRIRDLERYRYLLLVGGVSLLLMPLVPGLGRNINGNRIWIHIGPLGFQPGELAKIFLATFFAAYLVDNRELLAAKRRIGPFRVPEIRLRVLGPILLAWGASILVMVAERDLGSSLLFFTMFVGMVWIATNQWLYLVGGLGLFSAGSIASYHLFGHVRTRVQIWIDPWSVAQGKGYQIVQSAFAFGSGGVTGSGLALGSPQRIPYVSTDFIFAAIGEEMGFLGTAAIVIAFALLVASGLRTALALEHPFEKLLTSGLTLILGVQTFIIMGGVTRLVPLTGVTLPFVSYGGSSLVANYILLALLVRASHEANVEAVSLR